MVSILPGFTGVPVDNKTSSIDTPAYTTHSSPADSDGPFIDIADPPCQWILHSGIDNSRVRIWDVMILIPNALFLAYLLLKLRNSVDTLRSNYSPIVTTFYILVFVVPVINFLRCTVSMTVNTSVEAGDIVHKVLWLILRFSLLSTEISILIFGICFGHLDSRSSILRVLLCTSFLALIFSSIQGFLELTKHRSGLSVVKADNTTSTYNLFSHGGMIFLCTSSFIFFVIYSVVLISRFTRLRERFTLPIRRTFYYYVTTLAVLNLIQAIGSLLTYLHVDHSLCVVDVTLYAYFTLFDPLVYGIFLWKFLRETPNNTSFFYENRVDNIQESDQHTLPQ